MHRETERSAKCRRPPESLELLALLLATGVRVLAGVQLNCFDTQLRGGSDSLWIGVDEERGTDSRTMESVQCRFQGWPTAWCEHRQPSLRGHLFPLLGYEGDLVGLP